jgi:HK97 family phage major capsid protein
MTMKELEEFFAKQFQITMTAERAKLEAEYKAKAMPPEAITAEVEKALKARELEEDKKKTLRVEMMEQFEIAAAVSGAKGIGEPNPSMLIGQMIVSGLKAMEDKKATNIKNVQKDFIAETAKKLFPESKALHGMMQKDLVAGIPSAGGFAIPQILLPDYIKFLYANTILDKLEITRVPMPAGNFTLPRMDATSQVSWVGEDQAVDQTQPIFDGVNLRSRKLKALTAVSNTLLRQNVVGLDAWVSQDLQTVSRIALDSAFLYGIGTDHTPRGLKNIPNIQSIGSTSTALDKTTPINMIALLEQANIPMNNVSWIFNPLGKSWILQQAFASGPWAWADEMLRNKTLNGYQFVSSATVQKDVNSAYSDFWVGDFSLALWGVSYDLSLELSREGTFVSGGQTVSAFDQDLTLIRIIAEHDFSMRQPAAVVYGQYSKS